MNKISFNLLFLILLIFTCCNTSSQQIITGAEQIDQYIPLIKNKNVALVVNQTSIVGESHLIDTLLSLNVNIKKIFSPEHGFKGTADAGERVNDNIVSEIPIISLYGANKKPTEQHLQNIDVVVFDIQDVGARFYTYISTLHYVMEACAENDIPLIILDRPNPNGSYVAGPVLDMKFQSFVGMHPIPIVYGLTIGELAMMMVGEGWLKKSSSSSKVNKCELIVIKVKNYTHKTKYSLPVKPSPNLPNDLAIKLYPSLCLFEGTNVSVGRGTHYPFQVIGTPERSGSGSSSSSDFTFTPVNIPGMAKHPKHEGILCYGIDLRDRIINDDFTLSYLIDFYNTSTDKANFFNSYFNKLAGNETLQKQIIAGKSEAEIKKLWREELAQYKLIRRKYLLY
ncbi:MAG: DUF1343 domain-containing protein [Cytophagales bacterium]|nr:DUF1343 domain-containing protein [Cytophagales bacterium]